MASWSRLRISHYNDRGQPVADFFDIIEVQAGRTGLLMLCACQCGGMLPSWEGLRACLVTFIAIVCSPLIAVLACLWVFAQGCDWILHRTTGISIEEFRKLLDCARGEEDAEIPAFLSNVIAACAEKQRSWHPEPDSNR